MTLDNEINEISMIRRDCILREIYDEYENICPELICKFIKVTRILPDDKERKYMSTLFFYPLKDYRGNILSKVAAIFEYIEVEGGKLKHKEKYELKISPKYSAEISRFSVKDLDNNINLNLKVNLPLSSIKDVYNAMRDLAEVALIVKESPYKKGYRKMLKDSLSRLNYQLNNILNILRNSLSENKKVSEILKNIELKLLENKDMLDVRAIKLERSLDDYLIKLR